MLQINDALKSGSKLRMFAILDGCIRCTSEIKEVERHMYVYGASGVS